jgi:hypothetical protein
VALEQSGIYQRIGEFVVLYQWLENRLREIGWFILDPTHQQWPPTALRNVNGAELFNRVEELFLQALPKCELGEDLENDFTSSFAEAAEVFTGIRRARNRILHSAFVEFKAGGEVAALMRIDPRSMLDEETGERLSDSETLSNESFRSEFQTMAEMAMFFNRCYVQLLNRLPTSERT